MRSKRNLQGFSLVEVLLAVFICTIMVLSAAALMPVSNRARLKAEQYSRAATAAQSMLEQLRTQDYASITRAQLQAEGLIGTTVLLDQPRHFVAEFTTFTLGNGTTLNLSTYLNQGSGLLEVIELEDTGGRSLDLKTIIVTIRWREQGQQRQSQVSTMVARLR
ncbi:MAG: prepilin-type N-terminal cleavage/methylation domain-containing protein [Fimbriimonadia bacterium]|nr:prepilin-type N-terminal cleavage/methylation domain-containing protein [Fimbriimonadia bacterium]